MISKIDMPKVEGSKVYDNKGSTGALINYLVSSEDKVGGEGVFFNLTKDGISAAKAQKSIDENVKGLKASETKFISMTINPSNEELKHIGNDKEKMKLYIRSVMNNYATNFNKGKEVKSTDLVWNAIIHEHRYYTNADKNKFEKSNPSLKFSFRTEEEVLSFKRKNPTKVCPFETEARKPGNNMHVHVIVSKRDSAMKQTLSPHGKKDTFQITKFQKNNQDTFQKLFDYKKGQNLYKEMQIENISRFVNDINDRKSSFLDNDIVLKIADNAQWNGRVLSNIKQLNMDLYRAKNVEDVYRYLEIGPKLYWNENKEIIIKETKPVSYKEDYSPSNLGIFTGLMYDVQNMNNALNSRPEQHIRTNKNKKKRKKRNPDIE